MRWKLKYACLRARKTQRRVALESGITENRFSEIVNAWINPTDEEREAIVGVLGAPHEDNLFEIEPDDPVATFPASAAEARSRR